MCNPIALITFMDRPSHHYLTKSRKEHHLKLKDIAFILGIDQGNLSRFEAGKISSPKALAGYHILFNLSIQSSIGQVFEGGSKELTDRCFQLLELLEHVPNTQRNRLRREGVDRIISRLMEHENGNG